MILHWGKRATYVSGLVKLEVQVQSSDAIHLGLLELEAGAGEVLRHKVGRGGLGDDGNAALGGPSEEDLGGGLAVLAGEAGEDVVLHERGGVLGAVHVELDEAGRAKGGVAGDLDALVLGEAHELRLLEVGVQLDLESGGGDLGISEQVVDGLGLEVGDTDALGQAGADEVLHGLPRLADGGLAPADLLFAVDEPAGRVAHLGVDVLERDGEVHDVEVKVVDLPVLQRASAGGLDVFPRVERLPDLGDDEELLALHETILDGTGNSVTAFLFVAVVCVKEQHAIIVSFRGSFFIMKLIKYK